MLIVTAVQVAKGEKLYPIPLSPYKWSSKKVRWNPCDTLLRSREDAERRVVGSPPFRSPVCCDKAVCVPGAGIVLRSADFHVPKCVVGVFVFASLRQSAPVCRVLLQLTEAGTCLLCATGYRSAVSCNLLQNKFSGPCHIDSEKSARVTSTARSRTCYMSLDDYQDHLSPRSFHSRQKAIELCFLMDDAWDAFLLPARSLT